MSDRIPFRPSGATVPITVGAAASAATQVCATGTRSVRVMNDGTATAWINFGDVTVTAAVATSMPVGPGVTEVLSFPNLTAATFYVAAIAAGSTGKIYFTPGSGI